MKIVFLFVFLFFFNQTSNSQHLYCVKNTPVSASVILFELARIDCSNDSISILNQLPIDYYSSIFSACYDYISNFYYYCEAWTIYKMDAANGSILRVDSLHIPWAEHFYHIAFNPRDSCVYGIVRNGDNFDQWFSKYSPVTGHLDTLYPINPHVNVGIGCKSAFNALKQQYIIQSTTVTAIDISNGNQIYSYPIQNFTNEAFDHLAYSCTDEKLYGLNNNAHTEQEYFASLDTSGVVSHVNPDTLPVLFYKQYLGGSTIDNTTDTYYYPALGGILYGIDIHTGNIVYSHNYGPGFEFLFLESGSNYHCPVSGIKVVSNENILSPYPNPSSGFFNFDLSSLKSNSNYISIFDVTGKTLIEFHEVNGKLAIDLSNYTSGVYFYKIKNNFEVYSGKLILQ